MTSLLTYVPAAKPAHDESHVLAQFPAESRDAVVQASNAVVQSVEALTRAGDEEQANHLFDLLEPTYSTLAQRLADIYLEAGATPAGLKLLLEFSVREQEKLVELKVDLLGPEAHEHAMGALSSFDGYFDWILGVVARFGQGESSDLSEVGHFAAIWEEIAEPLTRAQMSLFALMLILSDNVSEWHPAAPGLLARLADDSMTTVEDEFLAGGDTEAENDLVPLAAVRESLNL